MRARLACPRGATMKAASKGSAAAVIPDKVNRENIFPFDANLNRLRNVIEWTFGRPKTGAAT